MPGIVRKGDRNDAGGRVIADVWDDVIINGRPAARVGSLVEKHYPHKHPHIVARCTLSSKTVMGHDKGLIYVGCKDTCGHTRIEGSNDVIIGR
jgi:uncharacterized Zn-binding protein involved in type VI secretion